MKNLHHFFSIFAFKRIDSFSLSPLRFGIYTIYKYRIVVIPDVFGFSQSSRKFEICPATIS